MVSLTAKKRCPVDAHVDIIGYLGGGVCIRLERRIQIPRFLERVPVLDKKVGAVGGKRHGAAVRTHDTSPVA